MFEKQLKEEMDNLMTKIRRGLKNGANQNVDNQDQFAEDLDLYIKVDFLLLADMFGSSRNN